MDRTIVRDLEQMHEAQSHCFWPGLRVSQLRSLWRDDHPAIKGLRPPEHHAGKFRQDHNDSSESKQTKTIIIIIIIVAPIA